MSNTFGNMFRVTTFGESHGPAIGVIIDGCPAGLNITKEDIQKEMNRRKPGQSQITTDRSEPDQIEILSGILDDKTLGTPIGMIIRNKDAQSSAYNDIKDLYRPGHADFTYDMRYGIRDWRGGGRASARETAARVAAGAVAKTFLRSLAGIKAIAWVEQIHRIKSEIALETVTEADIEKNIVRCPDDKAAAEMIDAISRAKEEGNSLGGKIKFRIDNCPAGFGAPVFDKLTADIAKACMSIPATRSISFGLGDAAIELTGLEHNDQFKIKPENRVGTDTNRAGGVLGGISNGEQIYGTIAFKPTSTIKKQQQTVTRQGKEISYQTKGRHDPCVLPRAVPIVEAMLNLVLADHLLLYSISNMDRLAAIFNKNK